MRNEDQIPFKDQVRMNAVRIAEEWLKIVLLKEQRKHLKERNKKAIQETLKEVRLVAENQMENQVKMKIQEGILQEEINKKPI